ncbi:hypothetical protein [Halomicrobium salinisoli]|uniref:hypothetical protein n=1 Tax=Halomicrobium salinisoli TaxID=2878391 RepID=UPI001CF07489|nr:hypothetical protein [Halomicrobium salinisoli]
MDHPAVELTIPFAGTHHRATIPRETTLFFWGAVAPGTTDQPPPGEDELRGDHLRALQDISRRVSCSVTLGDESKPLLGERYRTEGFTGKAWWIAWDPVELPATAAIEFTSTGEQPTIEGDDVFLWTEQGETIPWGATIERTIELVPSTRRAAQFPTRQDRLWNRHTVYVPNWQTGPDEPNAGRSR